MSLIRLNDLLDQLVPYHVTTTELDESDALDSGEHTERLDKAGGLIGTKISLGHVAVDHRA